ncbi:MAG: 50S ribosomal protein L28 [Acidithiobacillales bacterium]
MAHSCDICGKTSVAGHRISHAHNVSNRRFKPNVKSIRVATPGGSKRVNVCTRCLRSGRVAKAVR